jgi:hypothetical protein
MRTFDPTIPPPTLFCDGAAWGTEHCFAPAPSISVKPNYYRKIFYKNSSKPMSNVRQYPAIKKPPTFLPGAKREYIVNP